MGEGWSIGEGWRSVCVIDGVWVRGGGVCARELEHG